MQLESEKNYDDDNLYCVIIPLKKRLTFMIYYDIISWQILNMA